MITIFKKKWIILLPLLLALTTIAWDTQTCDRIIWLEGGDCPNGEPVVYQGQNYYCEDTCGYYGAENGEVICICMKNFRHLLER